MLLPTLEQLKVFGVTVRLSTAQLSLLPPSTSAGVMEPLPLATYAEGCVYRKWALQALRQTGLAHWIAFVSPSIAGILAAVRAGLAVAPIGMGALDASLRVLGPEQGFPLLPVSEVSLHRAAEADNGLVTCFADYVAESFQRMGGQAETG